MRFSTIFDKIIRKEIKSYIVFEDDFVRILMIFNKVLGFQRHYAKS